MTLLDRLRRRTPLGWLQLKREPTRLLAAIAGIAFADLLMFLQLGVLGALYTTNIQVHQALNADVVLLSPQARDIINSGTIPRARLYQAAASQDVAASEAIYLSFLDWKSPGTGRRGTMTLIGVEPQGHPLLPAEMANQLPKLVLPDSGLFDRGSRGDESKLLAAVDHGGTVNAEILRHTLTLIGAFRMGAGFGSDGQIVVSQDTFLHLFPSRSAGSITLGLLRLKPGADSTSFAARLNTFLPEDTHALTKAQFIQYGRDWQTKNAPIAFVFGLGTFMGFLMGIAMVYQILSSDVNEHMAEYATFKAMGYTNGYLAGVLFEESLILAAVGYGPGLLAGFGLYFIIHTGTALPIAMTWGRAIGVFFLTLSLSIVSGFLAARKVRKADPAEVFG